MTMWAVLWLFIKKLWTLVPKPVKLAGVALIACAVLYTGGRVWLAAHDAALRKDTLSGYVAQQKFDAANAQLVAVRKQLADAQALQQKTDQQRLADEQALALAKEQLDEAINNDTDPRGATWTEYDFQWLRDHGQSAGTPVR